MQLGDLPHFLIIQICLLDKEAEVHGKFDRLKGVREGRGWLYVSQTDSVVGDLRFLDASTGAAVFRTSDLPLSESLKPGSRIALIDGYWEPYQVAMILDPGRDWKPTVFKSTYAVEFAHEGIHGIARTEDGVPEGAVIMGAVPGGWDHEHCELCMADISPEGKPFGYVDPEGHWLCEACYMRYAATHDLSFLLE